MKTMIAVLVTVVAVSAAGKKLQVKDLPAAVQRTVQAEEARGAKVVGLSAEKSRGKTVYEVETTMNGHTRDLIVDAGGAIVESEEETSLDAVPAAVKAALEARGTVGKVETVTKGTTVTYEATVVKNGKKREIAVNALGKPIKP